MKKIQLNGKLASSCLALTACHLMLLHYFSWSFQRERYTVLGTTMIHLSLCQHPCHISSVNTETFDQCKRCREYLIQIDCTSEYTRQRDARRRRRSGRRENTLTCPNVNKDTWVQSTLCLYCVQDRSHNCWILALSLSFFFFFLPLHTRVI